MYEIKDSGERRLFETGANRDISRNKGRFDLLPVKTLRALAVHYERGCLKYGDRNWEKGISTHVYVDSAMRHLLCFIDGMDDENHLISAIWNLFCLYETKLRIQLGLLPETIETLPNKVNIPNPYESA